MAHPLQFPIKRSGLINLRERYRIYTSSEAYWHITSRYFFFKPAPVNNQADNCLIGSNRQMVFFNKFLQ
jgi:hypothetical protein